MLKTIGKSEKRIDGWEKITGAVKYTDDLEFGNALLYAAIVDSPYAYARIKSINTKKAEKITGVVKIVTAKDFPFTFGLYMQDRYIFAKDVVRFVGEQVAAVIADSPKPALKAAKLVEVKYQEMKPVLNPM